MPAPGWYNDNEFRDYPFVLRTSPLDLSFATEEIELSSESVSDAGLPLIELPQEAIVDFGAVMELSSAYDDQTDIVYLHAIIRVGDTFYYRFRTTATGADLEELVFARTVSEEEFATEWVNSKQFTTPLESSAADEGCQTPAWRGFMVSGRMADLDGLLPTDGTLLFPRGLWKIEPARIQNLAGTYVRSLNLANAPRTIALLPDDCDPGDQSTDVVVNVACLQGPLAFKEGFNCAIRQDDSANGLVIGASAGGGEGQPCQEVPLVPDEGPPDDSPFLSGGPACGEVLKTINGIGGTHLRITGGSGIQIYADPDDPNTLVVDRSLANFAKCLTGSSSESSIGEVP